MDIQDRANHTMNPSRKRPLIFYGWWIVVACSLIGLYTHGAISFGFTAIFEPISKEFGWSYAQISIAASLRGMESGILDPLMGVLVDRFGARKLMFAGAFVFGLGLMLLSRINSLVTFYAAFALVSIGMASLGTTVVMPVVVNWFRARMGTVVGIVSSGFALGSLLVPLVTKLVDTFGWRSTMFAFGLGTWVAGLPLTLVVRHKPEQYGYLPDGEVSSTPVVGKRSTSARSDGIDIGAKKAVTGRAFWLIASALTYQQLVASAVQTHIMPYLSSIGFVRSISSLVASAIPAISIGGRLSFGWIGDRIDRRRVLAVTLAMMGLGLLVLTQVTPGEMWLLVPFLILLGVGWGGTSTLRPALVGEYFGRSNFGTIFGFVHGIGMLGKMTGAPLAGWVFDKWSSYQGIWFVFAGLSLASIIVMLATPSAKKHDSIN